MQDSITFENFIKLLKIPQKQRKEEHIMMINAYLQENNVLEILFKNIANQLEHFLIIECFSNFLEICTIQNNEIIYRQDDHADKFFIILKGQVEVMVPVKKRVSITRFEYYKILENLLYEGDIGLIKLILNSNYEKISFENYNDFYEFAKAKAKIFLVDKFNVILTENNLEKFYIENFKIFNTFKIFKDVEELENLLDKNEVNQVISEIEESSHSEKDSSFYGEEDEKQNNNLSCENSSLNNNKFQNENEYIHKTRNGSLLENQKSLINRVRSPKKNLDQHFTSTDNESKKTIKFRISNNLFKPQKQDFTNTENNSSQNYDKFYSSKLNDDKEIINIKKIENLKKKCKNKLKNLKFKSINFPNFKSFKEETSELLKLNNNEEEILKKYLLMDNQIFNLDYNIFSTHPKILNEKDYFGDFGLDSANKKRTATVKGYQENTILGFLNKEIYNEYIYEKNQKILLKNIQFLNNVSFFKFISSGNFNKNYFKNFDLKKHSKNQFLLDQNSEVNKIYFIKEGKVDVSLSVNIFEIQSLMEEIKIKLFKNTTVSIREAYSKKFEELNFKKISKNQFKKEQLEYLYLQKNVNLFSLQTSEIIGIEPIFLKINSFYKVHAQSVKLAVYQLDIINFNKILNDYSESKQSFDKLAINKCLVILTRLNDIKSSILNLSNIKFKNSNNNISNDKIKNVINNTLELQNLNNIKENLSHEKGSRNSVLKPTNKGINNFNKDINQNSNKYINIFDNENSIKFNSNFKNEILDKKDSALRYYSSQENSSPESSYNDDDKFPFRNSCEKIDLGFIGKDKITRDIKSEFVDLKKKIENNGFVNEPTRNIRNMNSNIVYKKNRERKITDAKTKKNFNSMDSKSALAKDISFDKNKLNIHNNIFPFLSIVTKKSPKNKISSVNNLKDNYCQTKENEIIENNRFNLSNIKPSSRGKTLTKIIRNIVEENPIDKEKANDLSQNSYSSNDQMHSSLKKEKDDKITKNKLKLLNFSNLNLFKIKSFDVKDLNLIYPLSDRNKKHFINDFSESEKENNYLRSNNIIDEYKKKTHIKKKSHNISDAINLKDNLIIKENFSYHKKQFSSIENDTLFEKHLNSPKHIREYEKQLFLLKEKTEDERDNNDFIIEETNFNENNTGINHRESCNSKEFIFPNNYVDSKSINILRTFNRHENHSLMKIKIPKGFDNLKNYEEANFKNLKDSFLVQRKTSDSNIINPNKIQNNKISNIYFNESDRLEIERYSNIFKNKKSEENMNNYFDSIGNLYIKNSIKTTLINSGKNKDVKMNLLNQDNNLVKKFFNQKSVLMNRTFMKINEDKKLIVNEGLNKNSYFKNIEINTNDDNNKTKLIKRDYIDLDTFIPKESKINETYKNIHNLRNRIKESSVKKILFKKTKF